MFKKTLITLGLLGWSVFASATPILLNSPNQPYNVYYPIDNTPFNDTFQFTIAANQEGQAAAVALDLNFGNLDLLNISNLLVQADPNTPSSATPLYFTISSYTNAPTGGLEAASYQSDNLAAGTYIFDVSGITSGINGGGFSALYSLTLNSSEVSPVPLPSAAWLLGSALLGLISFGARGNRVG